MRKIKPSLWAALALALFVVLTGCITIETGGDVAGVTVEGAARRVAYHTAMNNPEIIKPALKMVASIDLAMENSDQTDLKALLHEVFKYVDSELVENDPLLVYEIESICEIIKIDVTQPPVDLDEDQLKYLQRAINGFKIGLFVAQDKLKEE